MFEKIFEKRSGTAVIDWTRFSKGKDSDDTITGIDSTYYKCINLYAENIAKLPINVKVNTEEGEVEAEEHYLYELLRLRPNPSMNAFECIKALTIMNKHYGSAGLYIKRNNRGLVEGLYPVRINSFTVDDAGLINSNNKNKVYVDFTCGDIDGSCFEKDIIILRDNSINGIDFKTTKSYLKDSIDTNIKAQKYQSDLFGSGLTNKIIVQLTSDIKDEVELKKKQKKFDRLYSSNGRIFTIPAGYNVSALNLSLADSQFAELKVQGKKDIASVIGIPYSLIEKGALTEEETISLLGNALIPVITAIEQEFDWKLLSSDDREKGYKIRFNINAMLRTTPLTQSLIIDRYLKNGAYTLNYAKEVLGVKLVPNGDIVTLPSGQITLDSLVNNEATWQKDNNTNQEGGDISEQGNN